MSEKERRIPLYIDRRMEEPPPIYKKEKPKKTARGSIQIENDNLKDLLILPDIIESE